MVFVSDTRSHFTCNYWSHSNQYEGWDWYLNIQSAPLYRRDLDIVAATATAEIAAFCTIWLDDATRSAVCVLVGTVPEHQRRGLGKAVMYEGLRRLKKLGATRVFANAYDPPADALYGSVLGTRDLSRPWVKEF
jgi:mycothiol synthase